MKNSNKLYEWEKINDLIDEFIPDLLHRQDQIRNENLIEELPEEIKDEIRAIGFSREAREPEDVARELIEKIYPYRMKVNHPRYFSFIPNQVSPYSIFGDFLNSIYNPYGGGYSISEGTATIENELIKWMGEKIGYDRDLLGGQFVSGGSMANLTASIVARDEKLEPSDYHLATVYVSDQTHSSVAKGVHLMGISSLNVRKVPSDESFAMIPACLEEMIVKDLEDGYKPFLLVGTGGTTNTGTIDPLEDLADIAEKYDLWYHVDGAYGASVILSSHKELLKGIERSDSISWDGHKWLFQTYGCASVICRDKYKMARTFSVDPEYLKDVKSTEEEINFWDMGMELTKPARGMRLWFTLQTVGLDGMQEAIDHGFKAAEWFEEEVSSFDHYEIVSPAQLGIINFRYHSDKYSEEELNEINNKLSQMGVRDKESIYFTTVLRDKVVMRFCAISPLITRDEVVEIIESIEGHIKELGL